MLPLTVTHWERKIHLKSNILKWENNRIIVIIKINWGLINSGAPSREFKKYSKSWKKIRTQNWNFAQEGGRRKKGQFFAAGKAVAWKRKTLLI